MRTNLLKFWEEMFLLFSIVHQLFCSFNKIAKIFFKFTKPYTFMTVSCKQIFENLWNCHSWNLPLIEHFFDESKTCIYRNQWRIFKKKLTKLKNCMWNISFFKKLFLHWCFIHILWLISSVNQSLFRVQKSDWNPWFRVRKIACFDVDEKVFDQGWNPAVMWIVIMKWHSDYWTLDV